jgi:hypothetical protein
MGRRTIPLPSGAQPTGAQRARRIPAAQLEGLYSDEEKSYIKASNIGGNLQLDNNSVRLVAQRNIIDGDLQAFSNTSKRIVIRYNTIDGNLQCKDNRPAPRGGFNRVSGNKEDQCARL